MQELVILLSSIAGAVSAVAIKKFPKDGTRLQSIGASSYIKNQITTLNIEKDILNKTIARLYENNLNLSTIQKDKLLLKYQHQLGIILAKLEKLDLAKRHPDLGPVGDGLITLMDQKLSQLDTRLYEISSKITAADTTTTIQTKKEKEIEPKIEKPNPFKSIQNVFASDTKHKDSVIPTIELPKARKKSSMEITTLTSISQDVPKYPFDEKSEAVLPPKVDETVPTPKVDEIVPTTPKEPVAEKQEILDTSAQIIQPETKVPDPTDQLPKLPTDNIITDQTIPSGEAKNTPKTVSDNNNEEEDDEDNLEEIKGNILKALSKLEQAEAE